MISISYAVCAHNEYIELDRLLYQLTQSILPTDEIVVQLDTTATYAVKNVVKNYNKRVKTIEFGLNNDFASFKNNLNKHCTCDFIFQLDADEYLNPWLYDNIHSILETNPEVDMFLVPRINTVEGLTEEHIKKWGWNVDHGRVNFPDHQTRVYRNNSKIKWINKVHERLDGYNLYTNFPPLDEMCIYHPKTIERQEKQNNYYESI